MNYNAINADISKAFYKGDRIRLGKIQNTVGITADNYVLYFIPEKEFIFDAEKLLRGNDPVAIERFISEESFEVATLTNELKKDGKRTIAKLKSETVEAWVDFKRLKHFDKDVTFKIRGALTNIQVYKNDTLIGLVCPININKVKEI